MPAIDSLSLVGVLKASPSPTPKSSNTKELHLSNDRNECSGDKDSTMEIFNETRPASFAESDKDEFICSYMWSSTDCMDILLSWKEYDRIDNEEPPNSLADCDTDEFLGEYTWNLDDFMSIVVGSSTTFGLENENFRLFSDTACSKQENSPDNILKSNLNRQDRSNGGLVTVESIGFIAINLLMISACIAFKIANFPFNLYL